MLTKKHILSVVVVVIIMMGVGVLDISKLLQHDNSIRSPNETVIHEDLPDYLYALPPKPDDFDSALSGLRMVADICELSEAYYLQPDFYVDSWEDGKRHYEEHDYSRWLVHGYGAYPAYPKAIFGSNKVGEEKQICTLYRTGLGVETWQGIKLVPEKSKYFDIIIEPDEFLLPPTFPQFDEEWVKKINITVKIKHPPPNATYKIEVNAVAPSEEKSKEWKEEVSNKEISIPQVEKMIRECNAQSEEMNFSLNCDELINLRRNKYIEGGYIDIGERLIIRVVVEEKGGEK